MGGSRFIVGAPPTTPHNLPETTRNNRVARDASTRIVCAWGPQRVDRDPEAAAGQSSTYYEYKVPPVISTTASVSLA